MTAISDTHCHLDFPDFEEDRDAVIERARQAGLERILIPAIDLESSRKVVELARMNESIFAAVGVHPNQADQFGPETIAGLKELAREPKVVAIGEIGLDFYRELVGEDIQAEVFNHQLEMAAELGLPVIIHNREATETVLNLLSEWHSNLVEFESDLVERSGVLHSYNEGLETAQEAREIGLYLGITGPITFKNASTLRETVSEIPLDRLLIETDSPYLSPEPFRGRRNEPAHVRFVAEKIAELHGTSIEVVSDQTSENARKLFLW